MHGLKFSGHDTLELATKYGTPLYVMSEDIILERIRSLKNAFEKTGANEMNLVYNQDGREEVLTLNYQYSTQSNT